MACYILSYLLVRHASHTGTKVSSCPKMLSPVSLLQMGKLILLLPRRYTLQILCYLRWAQAQRAGYQHMDMVCAHMPLQYLHIPSPTYLPQYFSCPFRHFSSQYLIPILRYPHKVVFDTIDRVRTCSIFCHTLPPSRRVYLNLLKLFA
jgi:hypothetical protein